MHLVIFGAGASYDSLPSLPPTGVRDPCRPPLASELFLTGNAVVERSLSKFPQCGPIVPYLRNAELGTVEEQLRTLQRESESDAERRKQICAIRFYLQDVVYNFDNVWAAAGGIASTNLNVLLDQLRRKRAEGPTLLATFNYDRTIERACERSGWFFPSMDNYVNRDDFKLFKLHGSVDWGRSVDSAAVMNLLGLNDTWRGQLHNLGTIDPTRMWQTMIDSVDLISVGTRIDVTIGGTPVCRIKNGAAADFAYPAIAIPVEEKSAFECPEEHVRQLEECLPKVDRVLVIGWQAAEEHFLKKLDRIPPTAKTLIVNGRGPTRHIVRQLSKAGLRCEVAEKGFTEFATSREAEEFLS